MFARYLAYGVDAPEGHKLFLFDYTSIELKRVRTHTTRTHTHTHTHTRSHARAHKHTRITERIFNTAIVAAKTRAHARTHSKILQ